MDRVEILPNRGWDSRVLVAALGTLVQTFLVVTRRYLVLVDTMINPDTAMQLVRLGRAEAPGRELLVLNTHADWDHYWGNQIFACPILGHRLAMHRAVDEENQVELAQMRAKNPELYSEVVLTSPTVGLEGRTVIDGGDLRLELIPTPGHQPDHLAVFLPEISLLLAGDAAEHPFPLVSQKGGLSQLRESIRAMQALKPTHAL
ncbi:MAG: MBL fold metallo-hydrolase, partial [Candidatus Eremiobacterota bacterium]